MQIDPKLEVQTIPSITWRGLFVVHGQVCPLRDAEVVLYTALSYEGDAWYTNMVGENAQSEVDVEARCLGRVPLGYGYGRWTVLRGGECLRDWRHMTISEWIALYKMSSPPGIGDLPVPVLYRPAADGDSELYDVSTGKVRRFSILDVPLLTNPDADAEKAGGDVALRAWRKEWRKVRGSAFVGFMSKRLDTSRHTGPVPLRYSCKWCGSAFSNDMVKTWHLLAKYA